MRRHEPPKIIKIESIELEEERRKRGERRRGTGERERINLIIKPRHGP